MAIEILTRGKTLVKNNAYLGEFCLILRYFAE